MNHTDSLDRRHRLDTVVSLALIACALVIVILVTGAVLAKPEQANPMRCDAIVDDLSYYAGPDWSEVRKTETGQWCVLTN